MVEKQHTAIKNMINSTLILILQLTVIVAGIPIYWRIFNELIDFIDTTKEIENNLEFLIKILIAGMLVGLPPTPIYFIKLWAPGFMQLPNVSWIKISYLVIYIIQYPIHGRIVLKVLNLQMFKNYNQKTKMKWWDVMLVCYVPIILHNRAVFKYFFLGL